MNAIDAQATQAGRIGPNAIIQTVQALVDLYGAAGAAEVLARIGKPELRDAHPASLIDERDFAELYHDLLGALGRAATDRVMARSGELTAQYVMRRRIPRPVHWLLRALPRRLGMRMLLDAIGRHAWTFAGSGQFRYSVRPAPVLTLENCLTARDLAADAPACAFYQAAFQGFLATLIDRRLQVEEVRCLACGAARCEFRVIEVTR